MFAYLTLVIAAAPALLLVRLFIKWDAKRPEPPGKVRNMMLFGVLACIPAGIIELTLTAVLGESVTHAQGRFLDAFLIAATTEEVIKLAVVFAYVWSKPHFDEVMDGILYVAAASLGFALLENILYAGGNMTIGILRAFTAVPMHALCSGIMGYFVGRAKMAPNKSGLILTGLGIAILIHGVYDWALFSGGTFGFGPQLPLLGIIEVVPLLIVSAVVLRVLIQDALKRDDAQLGAHARPQPSMVSPVGPAQPGPGQFPQGQFPQSPGPHGYYPHGHGPHGPHGT